MTGPATTRAAIHATCLVIGEAGVLVRGVSGSGKTSLALALIESAAARGRFARLVADDRVRLACAGGRLVARVPAATAGLAERRGLGVERVPFVASAVVRLVVDIAPSIERMPDEGARACLIETVSLARITVTRDLSLAVPLVMAALSASTGPRKCDPSALAFGRQDGKIPLAMATPSTFRPFGASAASVGPCSERNEFCAESQ